MFSGIKSIIFGYTDGETASSDTVASATSISSTQDENVSSSSSSNNNELQTPSELLEKTFNAATTKLTEQLLPQQASIEQLQSSSHQLLPSLNEQREEEEFNKEKKPEILNVGGDNQNDDDDDCLIVDSWELLDLNENTEFGTSDCVTKSLAVQKGKEVVVEKQEKEDSEKSKLRRSTSGILKKVSSTKSRGLDELVVVQKQQEQVRQKPKVSFETPDLVKDKHEIQSIVKPKDNIDRKDSNGKSKKRGGRKKVAQVNNATEKQEEPTGYEETFPSMASTGFDAKLNAGSSAASLTPNYAAILSKDTVVPLPKSSSSSSLEKSPPRENESIVPKQIGGGMKRNRPVSTSSWSSSDDIGTIENKWTGIEQPQQDIEGKKTGGKDSSRPAEFGVGCDEDNESILSSGFSDCDYGYEGFNDFVMRPKKSNSKRDRRSSSSSSAVAALSKEKCKDTPEEALKVSSSSGESSRKQNTSSKPKKKKIVLSAPSGVNSRSAGTSVMRVNSGSARQQSDMKDEPYEKLCNSSKFPPALTSNSCSSSSNDSGDLAEMYESWYVTPPPCFTGSNKSDHSDAKQPRTKAEAARENALIEHPSIFLASSSGSFSGATLKKSRSKKPNAVEQKPPKVARHVKKNQFDEEIKLALLESKEIIVTADADVWQSDDELDNFENLEQKPVVESKTELVVEETKWMTKTPKSKTSTRSVNSFKSSKDSATTGQATTAASNSKLAFEATSNGRVASPRNSRAWKNKFAMDDWNLDDAEDIDSDFDNMFEPTRKKKLAKTKLQRKQPKKPQFTGVASPSGEDTLQSLDVVCFGFEDEPSGSTKLDSAITITEVQQVELSNIDKENNSLNVDSESILVRNRAKSAGGSKQPTQVSPIGPERRPGWQLRRQRSKRRPLSTAMAATNCKSIDSSLTNSPKLTVSGRRVVRMPSSKSTKPLAVASSEELTGRTSPTLINRIGSSIVANLSNLTSGFASRSVDLTTLTSCVSPNAGSLIDEAGRFNNTLSSNSGSCKQIERPNSSYDRKYLSKGSLHRQNSCAQKGSSQRRAGRQLKMFSTPNGSSVNRKVQTKFH